MDHQLTHSLKQTNKQTNTHTHTHTHTYTQTPLNEKFVYIVCVDTSLLNTHLHPGSDLTRNSNGRRQTTFLKGTFFRNIWRAKDKREFLWKLMFQGSTACNLIDACHCFAGNFSSHLHGWKSYSTTKMQAAALFETLSYSGKQYFLFLRKICIELLTYALYSYVISISESRG